MTMIFVDRSRLNDGHAILPLGTWGHRAATRTAEAIDDGPGHAVSDLYRDPGVKAALEKLFNSKCAYCESQGFAGFPWDVEHFRPKASVAEAPSHTGYYWLAYTWANLYASCVFCNQWRRDQPTFDDPTVGLASGKLDQFPLADENDRARIPADSLQKENPLILDPCSDEPGEHLRYDATCEVSASEGSVKGEVTIRVFGLNRKRLLDARRAVLDAICELIEELVSDGVAKDRARDSVLSVLSRPRYPYLAMVQAIKDDPAVFGL